jgi:hypothetical protein
VPWISSVAVTTELKRQHSTYNDIERRAMSCARTAKKRRSSLERQLSERQVVDAEKDAQGAKVGAKCSNGVFPLRQW